MTNKTALVVGGTSGIGLATARRLHAMGAATHVVGRDKTKVDGLDSGLIGHQADGGSAAEMNGVLESIGGIDWLIVTVAGAEGVGPFPTLDIQMLRRAFEAKFWAHITTVQSALSYLAPDGSITLIGAITARAGMPGTAGIGSLNAAVEGLVKPLAVELAPIRVNAVSPGLVDTPWWSGMPVEAREAYFDHARAVLPARHVATADDIAEVVVMAATNRNLTGSVIETDAGARLVSLA